MSIQTFNDSIQYSVTHAIELYCIQRNIPLIADCEILEHIATNTADSITRELIAQSPTDTLAIAFQRIVDLFNTDTCDNQTRQEYIQTFSHTLAMIVCEENESDRVDNLTSDIIETLKNFDSIKPDLILNRISDSLSDDTEIANHVRMILHCAIRAYALDAIETRAYPAIIDELHKTLEREISQRD
jgi:hypothetical protein